MIRPGPPPTGLAAGGDAPASDEAHSVAVEPALDRRRGRDAARGCRHPASDATDLGAPAQHTSRLRARASALRKCRSPSRRAAPRSG
jgi:hypothetical protein